MDYETMNMSNNMLGNGQTRGKHWTEQYQSVSARIWPYLLTGLVGAIIGGLLTTAIVPSIIIGHIEGLFIGSVFSRFLAD